MAEENQDSILTTDESSYEERDWNHMEWYDNIFDIPDENCDTLEYTTNELNQYFTSGHINSLMDEEEIIEDDYLTPNDDTEFMEEEEKEEVLSQKFSQLSTKNDYEEDSTSMTSKKRQLSSSSNSDVIQKKIKLTDDDDEGNNDGSDSTGTEQDQIPSYLLTTDKSFDQMIRKVIDTSSSLDLNDLRQIALLKHHLAALIIQKQITTIYLLSGTGKLRESEPDGIQIDRRIWPMQVKSKMLLKHVKTNDEHIDCLNLVHQRLHQLNDKIQQYEKQLNEKKSHLVGFTSTIEQAIDTYVDQHGIIPLEMKRDLDIALVEHDYDAEILERKYLQEEPNNYQIETAHRLYQARYELEKSKRELLLLKQQVFYNKPPISFDSIDITLPTSTDDTTTTMAATNDNVQNKFMDKNYEETIRRKKLDLIAIHVVKTELKFYQSEKHFNSEYSKMKENHRTLVKNKGMPTTLSNLIAQRFTIITNRFRDLYYYKLNYYLRSSYGDLENMEKKKKKNNAIKQNTKSMGFSPHLIVDTNHQLNDKQLQLLNRGPAYVPPCQMYVSSSSESIDNIVKKQYAPLKHQLLSLFQKHRINIASKWDMETEIRQKFVGLFSMSIPDHIRKRATYEKSLIQSIRCSLNRNHLILRRTADNQNTFYLGNKQDFEAKANDYLTKSDAYEVLTTIDDEENNEETLQDDLKKRIESMNFALGILKRRKALNKDLVDSLLTNATKTKLPYLYFLPDVSKGNEISLVPMIVSQQSATSKIAKYVYQLIQPFADGKMQNLTFRDEVDFMQKLHYYVYNQHRLKSTTLFCTIKITNYYALDAHERMIDTITYFLQEQSANNTVNKVSIMTIKNLLQLFFYNNLFRYNNKIYTIIKGSPNTMPLTDLLSNIYLFDWQKSILKEVERSNELLGRYKDEIFFTWNASDETLRSYLHTVQKQKTNVHFRLSIGPNVRFLNAYVANQEGQLYTRVYHDPSIQSHTLPYVVGHSKLSHSHWLRSALIRAVCYCSSVEDFHQERIYLELTCLINGYTFLFVESHVYHFFNYYNDESMRYRLDQPAYHSFRSRWFDFLDMQHTLSVQLQKLDDNGKIIRFHYLYDYGPRCQFNQDFHQCWGKYFRNHPILSNEKMKIILTTKHFHSLNALLTQYKSWH